MTSIVTVASRQELNSAVSRYASKGFIKVHEDAEVVTLSRKRPFNWIIAIVCFFIPIIGWIALIMMIMAANRGNDVVEVRISGGSAASVVDPEWVALSKYDPDVSRALEYLSPLGHDAAAQFRDTYLHVRSKDAIPKIVNDIAAEFRARKEALRNLRVVQQGQLGNTKYDLRSDGTVIGHTLLGPKVFSSMQEFRHYVGA